MDRDGFSVISLTSLGSTVSHRVLSSAEELNELNSTLRVPDERLSSFALRLYQLHQHIGSLDAALNSASAISGRLQTTLSQSLGSCDVVSTVLNKQVMRLQAETLPMLDEMFLVTYNDAVLAFTRLFAFFAKVLFLSNRDEQDSTLDGKSGREVFDHVSRACQKASQTKEILFISGAQNRSFASSSKGPLPGDSQPPPYEPAQASMPQSPSGESSSSGSGFAKGLSSLTSSFKAMTSGLWPKPDPLSTALCQAALRGDVQQMSGLLAQGANINGRNGEGNAPLSCAILANQEDAAKFLLGAGADVNSKDMKMPPVFLAASVGSIGVAKMLINQGTWNANASRMTGQSYFVDVCNSENLEGIKLLLENGSKPNVTNTSGRPVIAQAVKKGNIELVRLLLRHGANPDSSDATGNSILVIAANQDRMDMVKLLLESRTNPNAKGLSGQSVLADCINKRKLDMAEVLLEYGANASAKDLYGHPVLVIALRDSKLSEAEKTRVVKMLLDHGASANVSDGTWGVAAICFAMETGSTDLVRMMLQAGASTKKKMNSGETLLLYAIDNGRRDQAKLLLEAGADANAVDKKGRTPLMQAISRRDTELIKVLKAYGADSNVGGCISPAELAQSMGDLEILQMLGCGTSTQSRAGPVARPHSPPPGYDTAMGKV
ncbi:ankyrin repeat-containing domain protein [Fusarium acuminatum]|uniref:Ankyrin repeat-containing domain protein n=1 Tax=Fusarium acuminatum TaxID=5515 RepID=A0ABZ2WK17_9HYPO